MTRDRFQRGSGCFTCDRCGRQTRDTGHGSTETCALCWDILGWENTITDCGEDSEDGKWAQREINKLEAEIISRKEKIMTKVTAKSTKDAVESTFKKKAAIKAAAQQVADTKMKPEEQRDVIVQRTGATPTQAKKALETVKADEAFRTDPKFRFEERVKGLMKKGDTREQAEATISRVIRLKELPQAPVTPGQEVPLETLAQGQHFHTDTKDAKAARKMGHKVLACFGYVVHQGAGSVVVNVSGKGEQRMAPDMVVMALDEVTDLTLLSGANAVSSESGNSIQNQMEEVMAKGKKAVAVKAGKKAAAQATNGAAKVEAVPRVSKLETQHITLLKAPAEGEVKGQALIILNTLKGSKKGMTVAELLSKLEGQITTKNVLGLKDVWNMNRPKLLAGKYISLE